MDNQKFFPKSNKRITHMLLIISLLATACLIVFTGSASAGIVTSGAGDPIEGALVKLVNYPQYNDTTDVLGAYTINNVPYGTYTISASADGYGTNTSTVTVDGPTITKDFILTAGYEYYYASGSITDGTDLYLHIGNTNDVNASVDVHFMLTNGSVVIESLNIPANTSVALDAKTVLPVPSYFATKIISDKLVATERTVMFAELDWGGQIIDGVHDTVGSTQLATTWYFGGGSITPDTYAYITVLNPNSQAANVTVDYVLTNGSVISTSQTFNPTSRGSFDPRTVLPLPSYFSIVVSSDIPIMSERVTTFANVNWAGKTINGFHDTIGATTTSKKWYFASGSITPDTYLYVLIQNPNAQPANVTASYLLTNGTTVNDTMTINPTSRASFDPRNVLPIPSYFSVIITSDVPVVGERTVVFADLNWGGNIINGFHNTVGSTQLANSWALGGGYVDTNVFSYVTLLNPNDQPANINASILMTDGSVVSYNTILAATSRGSIDVGSLLPAGSWYSAKLDSDQPIFAEKVEIYSAVTWNGKYMDGFGATVASVV